MVKYENPTPAHTTTPAAPMQNTQADVQTDGKQTGSFLRESVGQVFISKYNKYVNITTYTCHYLTRQIDVIHKYKAC